MKKLNRSIRFFLWILFTFVVVSFSFLTFSVQPALTNTPLNYLAIAVVNGLFLFLAVHYLGASGWKFFLIIFLVYYALTGFLVGNETVYVPEQLPLDIAFRVLINSAIVAVILSGIGVFFFGQSPASVGRETYPYHIYIFHFACNCDRMKQV